jgi:tetratricopeptide (TPR) repeat protein
MIRKYMRQFGPAENHLRRSLELNPCDADTLMQMGYLQALRGKPVEGLGWMQRALRLNPMHPDWYNVDHAIALYCVGEYRSAAAALERLPILRPWAHAFIAAGQAKAGNPGAAREHVARMRRQDPDFDPVQDAMLGWNFEHREDLDHLVDGIRLALRA